MNLLGSGGLICTADLKIMTLASYYCSTPHRGMSVSYTMPGGSSIHFYFSNLFLIFISPVSV